MRDLARYDRADQSHEPIKMHRRMTEKKLQQQLQRTKSFLYVKKVMALVFEIDLSDFRTFLAAMLTALDCDIESADADTIQLIQDTWNYFPHRELDGYCPAEVMIKPRRTRTIDKRL